jgi:hypothetical protein
MTNLREELAGLDAHADAVTADALAALAMLQKLYDNAELSADESGDITSARFSSGTYADLEQFLYPDPNKSLYDKVVEPLQERVKALEGVLRAITDGMQTECDYGRAGTLNYCFAHAYAFSEECPYGAAERILSKGERHERK